MLTRNFLRFSLFLVHLLVVHSGRAQVDTSLFIKTQRLRFDAKPDYWLVEKDSNSIGIVNEQLEWVLKPNYCAIYDFDPEKMIASVRSCPFDYRVAQMAYWSDPPMAGNWGIVDTKGNWLVNPVYYQPIELDSTLYMAFNYSLFRQSPIYLGRELWPDSYERIRRFGDNGFILKRNNEFGIRKLNGEWIVPYGHYKLIVHQDNVFLIPNNKIDALFEYPILKVSEGLPIEKIWTYTDFLQQINSYAKPGEYIEESDTSSLNNKTKYHYLANDSVFGHWFYATYWDELFESIDEIFAVDISADGRLENVFADSIYADLPEYWYPFERVEDNHYNKSISKIGHSTYSIKSSLHTMEYGSRGPAYEHIYHDVMTVQVVKKAVFELQLEDCFKNNDLSLLRNLIKETFASDYISFLNKIDSSVYLWTLTEDSITMYFNKDSRYDYNFNIGGSHHSISLAKSLFRKQFINERKRKRRFKKNN